jgi:hypothetical protein
MRWRAYHQATAQPTKMVEQEMTQRENRSAGNGLAESGHLL